MNMAWRASPLCPTRISRQSRAGSASLLWVAEVLVGLTNVLWASYRCNVSPSAGLDPDQTLLYSRTRTNPLWQRMSACSCMETACWREVTDTTVFLSRQGGRWKSTNWLSTSVLPIPDGTLGSQGALCSTTLVPGKFQIRTSKNVHLRFSWYEFKTEDVYKTFTEPCFRSCNTKILNGPGKQF